MGGGLTVILIIAIGAGYYLYQKLRVRDESGIIANVRVRLTDRINRILSHRNLNRSIDYQQSPVQMAAPHVNRPASNRPLVPAVQDNITETGPMIYFANDRHGRRDREYRFNYKKVGNGWRAYIIRTPNLGHRNTSSGVIHRLNDSNGYYICWDRQVETLKDIQIISRRWADSIQEYISTGRFG